ncbi:MAG: hypothetical protein QOI74_1364 [Micromonosporaceae bacterium]|nr:hypothetical protein [Micromonosporaceae bacterium]MDT5036622.1 hypothetical protein [Micromonosporaceae bacterium]
MSRRTQAVLLLVVGAAVLRASTGELYLRYVKSGLRPLLIVGGIVLVITALMTLWHELTGRTADADGHGHPPGDGHGHGGTGSRAAWLLVVPLFGMLLITAPALGSYAATHDGTVTPVLTTVGTLPAGDPVRMRVVEYASRAAYGHSGTLAGRQVALTGFVATDPSGHPFLARMLLRCCAADAGPVKVGLTGQVPGGVKPDVWLEVTGRYSPTRVTDRINGGVIPYLDVTAWRVVAAPSRPYESPQ